MPSILLNIDPQLELQCGAEIGQYKKESITKAKIDIILSTEGERRSTIKPSRIKEVEADIMRRAAKTYEYDQLECKEKSLHM